MKPSTTSRRALGSSLLTLTGFKVSVTLPILTTLSTITRRSIGVFIVALCEESDQSQHQRRYLQRALTSTNWSLETRPCESSKPIRTREGRRSKRSVSHLLVSKMFQRRLAPSALVVARFSSPARSPSPACGLCNIRFENSPRFPPDITLFQPVS